MSQDIHSLVGSLTIKVTLWLGSLLAVLGLLTLLYLLTASYSANSSLEVLVGRSSTASAQPQQTGSLPLAGRLTREPIAVLVPLEGTTSSP